MEVIDEDAEKVVNAEAVVPSWHTLKLCCIGKAYSGKKSSAKMIKEQLGDDITIFIMDAILREALSYVSTEKKEELPDPKAKKGKSVEPVHTDIFASLDTAAYK